MLAAAAMATTDAPLLTPAANPLSNPGPFNLAASLPSKVAKRILDLRCLRSQLTTTSPRLQDAHRPRPACQSQTFPCGWSATPSWQRSWPLGSPTRPQNCSPNQATIVWAEQNYEGKRWVTYDCQFLREALAWKDLNWSATNPRLLRCLVFVEAHNQCFLHPTYIDTKANHLADALSRDHLSVFLSKVPGVDPQPSPVSLPLLDLLLGPQADWTSPIWRQQFNTSLRRV